MRMVFEQLQTNVANALKLSQDDLIVFTGLVRNGAFIAKQQSLNASTENITRTLDTFIVSQALQANNATVTLADNRNPHEVSQILSQSSSIAQRNAWHVNCHKFRLHQPWCLR